MTSPTPVLPPAGATEYHAVSIYDNGQFAMLTMYVDDTSRMVVGWHMVNNLTYPVEVNLSEGAWSADAIFQPGVEQTGTVPKNRQWNYDEGGSMTYGLTPRYVQSAKRS